MKLLVGTGRFELPTPRTPSECSTRLSHVPTWKDSADSTSVLSQSVILQRRGSTAILHYSKARNEQPATANPASSLPHQFPPATVPPARGLFPYTLEPATA